MLGLLSPMDIAPTLATILRVEEPSGSIGWILSEIFQKRNPDTLQFVGSNTQPPMGGVGESFSQMLERRRLQAISPPGFSHFRNHSD
jgi:hypothetical protein